MRSFLERGRVPHCMLIEGEPGAGKKRLAAAFAAALLCEGEEAPCGACPHCKKVEAGIHPDMHVMGAGGYAIDRVRAIAHDAALLPTEGRCLVFILGDIETILPRAANALLKLLEEPPQNVFFMLTAPSRSMLLPTVASRAVAITLLPPSVAGCAEVLAERFPDRSLAALSALAERHGGNVGRAIDEIDNPDAAACSAAAEGFVAAVLKRDRRGAMAAVAPFERERERFLLFLQLAERRLTAEALAEGTAVGRKAVLAALQSVQKVQAGLQQNGSLSLAMAEIVVSH